MSWIYLLLLAVLGVLAMMLILTKRTAAPRGDQIGPAYKAAAALISNEANSFRSRLRQLTDTELGSMVEEQRRLQAFLEQEEKVLADRHEQELLASVRVALQQARARAEWMKEECNEREAARMASMPAVRPSIVSAPPSPPA